MAKKKEGLTLEERLQAALVPESEQPYPVPGNWCWTYLTKGAAECLDSFRKPINAAERANREGDIPYYGATGQVGWIDDFLTNEQLVLVGEDGAPFLDLTKDKAYIIEGKAWVNNHAHILRSHFGNVGNLFLMHYLNIFNYHDFVNGTTRLKLTQGSMDTMPVPIPPLSEQQRIVDRIESLFAKLDEAKQKAQDALDSFETRKAGILHKAFTGELTAQWRKDHGVGMESWGNKVLSQLAKQIKAGGDKPNDFTEEADEIHNIPVVANGVTDEGIIGYTASARFSGETITVAGRGTIGFSIYRTYPFFPIVRLIVIEPQDFVKAAYIKYAFDAFPESGTGSSIPQLTVPMVKEKIIPLPELNEQTEIVRLLDDLLAKEQQAKEAAEGVLEQIDLIKKAILARAFRGELGTNDPSEESAAELVKRALAAEPLPKTRSQRRSNSQES